MEGPGRLRAGGEGPGPGSRGPPSHFRGARAGPGSGLGRTLDRAGGAGSRVRGAVLALGAALARGGGVHTRGSVRAAGGWVRGAEASAAGGVVLAPGHSLLLWGLWGFEGQPPLGVRFSLPGPRARGCGRGRLSLGSRRPKVQGRRARARTAVSLVGLGVPPARCAGPGRAGVGAEAGAAGLSEEGVGGETDPGVCRFPETTEVGSATVRSVGRVRVGASGPEEISAVSWGSQ